MNCQSEFNDGEIFYHEVEESILQISPEISSAIGAVAEVKAVSGGFLMFDYGREKMHRFDEDWNHLFSFGGSGSGPGEFQAVYNFWEVDDVYMIYDYESAKFINYDREGNWIADTLIESDGFPWYRPVRFEALKHDCFVIPSLGKDDSLLKFVNTSTDSIYYFGNAVGDYVLDIDPVQYRQAILGGRIPLHLKNGVSVGVNQSGIFSFQHNTAVLEKYSHTGELIWKKVLDLPILDELFDLIFTENARRLNEGQPTNQPLTYATDLFAADNGIAILLNVGLIDDQPVTVAWVPNNGEELTVITFSDNMLQPTQTLRFTLSEINSQIVFSDAISGTVYSADWPL